MRIGILSDPHLSFSRYTKVNSAAVNQREADFYEAFIKAVDNLIAADVDAILDLGDLADSPHPKKRALRVLIETIKASGLPWWSVNGNHTLVRHSTDIHLYDVLEHYCPNFTGVREPQYVEAVNAFLIPYGTSDEIKAGLAAADRENPDWIGGHWACDDVLPDGHDISTTDLPEGYPVLLGHFHGRSVPYPSLNGKASLKTLGATGPPVYIGATERKAWGEALNPTGAAVWDTTSKVLTFIDHPTRDWIDLNATAGDYLDVLKAAELDGWDAPIVRLTIAATREEYRNVDELAAHRLAANALDLTIRRRGTDEEIETASEPVAFALRDDWRSQVAGASIPDGIQKEEVERIGVDALVEAGVAA